MRSSEKLNNFLIKEEGIKYTAYPDRGGHSIGAGHHIKLPEEAHLLTATLTLPEVKALLKKDLLQFEQELARVLFPIKEIPQAHWDLLIEALYNYGLTKFLKTGIITAYKEKKYWKVRQIYAQMDKGLPPIKERRLRGLRAFPWG